MTREVDETSQLNAHTNDPVKLNKAKIGKMLKDASQLLDQIQPEKDSFWTIKASKKKGPSITLHLARFNLFLQRHGFFKLYQGKSKVFIQVIHNIMTEVTIDQMKDFIRNSIESLPEEIV